MNKTPIAWTDYTSNPIRARNIETGKTGHFCEKVSKGCENCYASEWNENRYGTGLAFDVRNRSKVEMYLEERELAEWQKPKYAGAKVFVCDMTDWAGEWVKDEWHERIFEAMDTARDVTFQLLTKRAWEAQRIITQFAGWDWPLPNVWLGVSVENQHFADERIPLLLDTPAAIRFISYEPALEAVDFTFARAGTWNLLEGISFERLDDWGSQVLPRIDWLICGGESGPNRRPFDLAWARSVRDQCAATGTAFFFKQAGAFRSETPSGDPGLDSCKAYPVRLPAGRDGERG